jgi:hypothetical protein
VSFAFQTPLTEPPEKPVEGLVRLRTWRFRAAVRLCCKQRSPPGSFGASARLVGVP